MAHYNDCMLLTGKDRVAVIIAVGAFFICVTMGVRQSFGLYLPIYTETLGIGRDTFSLAIGLQNIMWGIASPFFGALADRRGPTIAVTLGGVLFTLGMLLMAMAGGGGTLTLAQIFVGLGVAGAGFSVVLGTVGKIVPPKRRAFSLAIVTAAGSFGQFVIVPLAQMVIAALGARSSLLILGGVSFLIILCAPLFKLPTTVPRTQTSISSWTVLAYALRSHSYVLLLTGFFVCGFQVVFVATHLPAYAADAGLSPASAVTALAFIGLFNIIGTLTCGWLGDRIAKKDVLAIFYLLRAAVIAGFLIVPLTPFSLMVFGAAIGFLWLGTVPLTSGLVAVMFGARHLSMLYGFVFFSHQVGSFCGAWLGGLFYDWLGGYDVVWYLSIALGVLAAILHYPIRERADAAFFSQFA
ncbi:MFS transporter [Candidatus Persebacteraceae bacterium Df01]|uniref:MFS transporter n=1 Tax=Candidatus Doriopsillibacter californiensis TaxID=2970740 RepID=A0ABT7QKL8_9GAMM|nr:MFS transporter [Candidatus Persebacteraceae bacterium Df01]